MYYESYADESICIAADCPASARGQADEASMFSATFLAYLPTENAVLLFKITTTCLASCTAIWPRAPAGP